MVQVYWQLVLFSSHRVQSIISISELNYLFSIAGPNRVIIHHADVLDQFYESSLHIASVSGFYRSIDNTLSAAHCVEKELCCGQSREEAVFNETSRLRSLE